MTRIIFTFLAFLLVIQANAQQNAFSMEFGKVTPYELGFTEYEKDKEAEAVVLYHTGRYYFSRDDARGGFDLNMEITTKIKVFKQAGIKYGEFEIPYYIGDNDSERVWNLEASTHNIVNGIIETTPLEKKNIYEEKPNENWRVKRFAMPDVREGSVIELQYTIATPFFFNMREWRFQRKIPVVHSSLEYRAIPFFEYVYIVKGTSKLDVFTEDVQPFEIQYRHLKYKEISYKFGMDNLPAFRDEEFITSENDYIISVNFQLSKVHQLSGTSREIMSTWPLICDELMKQSEFGKYLQSSQKEAKGILSKLGVNGKSDIEKIKIITDYVKGNYSWNNRITKYASSAKAANFVKQKTGNSADINLFLAGMLKAAGFDVHPVVLSTRRNGIINTSYPFMQFLDYTIVQVAAAKDTLLLDATEPLLGFKDLPARCLNVGGLVVKPGKEEWIPITQNDMVVIDKSFEVKAVDGKLKVQAKISADAHDGLYYRSIYRNEQSNLAQMLKNSKVEVTSDIHVENYNNPDQPFVYSFDCEYPFEVNSDKLFIPPFLNQSVSGNIFNQNTRTLPVDLVLRSGRKYKSVIEIPDGYKVEHIPESITYDNRVMKITYEAVVKDNKIEVTAGYEFKRNIYLAAEYPALKVSYTSIIEKFNDMIVLSK